MMTRSKGKQSRSWAVQVVHIQDPPVNSAAHLCLLAKKYFSEDKSIYSEFRMHKLRNKWMKIQMREHLDEQGGLTCADCKRMGLNPWTPDVRVRAVLDHKIEIAVGGSWRDPENFQVLCDRCNNQKNDKLQKFQALA
jgi:5-methylcytosine-specific restriction endonuclease McrA